jgi:uncharacterized damage-inducible protein DinB
MKERFVKLAAYNQWANRRLYDAASAVDDAAYRADRGAFFKSLHGTLSHLVVADRIWLRRFTGEGPAPTRLDELPYDDFRELRRAREAEDDRLQRYVTSLDEATLAAPCVYSTITNPAQIEQPLHEALDHVFNHQTHHRGQAHGLLTLITGDAPSLDLLLLQFERGWALRK